MTIKILKNCTRNIYRFKKGDVREVDEEIGKKLIELKNAEEVTESNLETTEPEPETTSGKPNRGRSRTAESGTDSAKGAQE